MGRRFPGCVTKWTDSNRHPSPVAAPFLLYLFPVIGPFLAYTVGIAILLIETYLGFYDPDGQRGGDTFAETLVVEYRQGSDGVPLSDRRA